MAENEVFFVEWMEEFVSQERGSRVVHYLLKDSEGNSVLAVVGTERSLRHMVYVVAEEFLSYSCTDNTIQAGFKWRSRREVVDWLTSMLSKQQQTDSPGVSTRSFGSGAQLFSVADKMDHRVRNFKQSYSDIVWLGASWTCGKQLKHFPGFCRNGTTIAVQSFVFVMAKEENRYVAYLEDMYEDKKGQKKVKVRWFHHSQEVKGVVRLRNSHPKEVYITPYTQVISVECVDGPAIVLTRDHFEKCIGSFPDGLLGKVHVCFRQFRSNKIKPFDLSKLRGYCDQPLISCLDSDTLLNSDSGIKVFEKDEFSGKRAKRKRNSEDLEGLQLTKAMRAPLFGSGYSGMSDRKGLFSKNMDSGRWHTQLFKVHDKIELLCQDSGIRGCWFRCTILEISRKQIKLEYSDLEDQDGCGNLKEWVPAFRLAAADKLGMRCLERPAIRPFSSVTNILEAKFEIGDPVDAWWSDGWWEGVVTAVNSGEDDNLQIYAPGENLFLNIPRKDIRISRDWVSGNWIDVKANRDILSAIGQASKLPTNSAIENDGKADTSAPKTEVDGDEVKDDHDKDCRINEKTEVDGDEVKDDHDKDCRINEKTEVDGDEVKDNLDNDRHINEKTEVDGDEVKDDLGDDGHVNETSDTDDNNLVAQVMETSVLSEHDTEKEGELNAQVVKIVASTEKENSGNKDKEALEPIEETLPVSEQVEISQNPAS
ncbi:hypothetical protein KSS87_015139 [Heliosperma pusillum]|nr:hypothetical protein KSS87_015139 [Heliosperma pusillum]